MKPFGRKYFTVAMLAALGAALGTAAIATATPALAQKEKDTLRYAFQRSTQALDAYLDPGLHTTFTQEIVFDTVISYNDATMKFEPLLAKSWTRISPTVVEMELRDDIKWHDGQAFDADDVVYTFNWLTDPKTRIQFKPNWSWVDKVEKLSPTKVRFTAKKPTPFDLLNLAVMSPIMPEHVHGPAANKADFVPKSTGTGPYRAVSVDTSRGAVLERSDAFKHGNTWKTPAKIKRIEIMLIPDFGTQVAQLLAGGVDLATMPWAEAQALSQSPNHYTFAHESFSYVSMMIDSTGRSGIKELQDPRVRRALMMAVNPKEILQVVAGDTKVDLPEHVCWKNQFGCSYTKLPPKYDPEGAKKLLAEAGYPNGFDIDVYSVDGIYKDTNQVIAGQLRKIGVRASSKAMTRAAFRQEIDKGKMGIVATVWNGGGMADVAGSLDYFLFADLKDYIEGSDLRDLATKSASEMDDAKRKQMVGQIMDRFTDSYNVRQLIPAPTVYVARKELQIGRSAHVAGGLLGNDFSW
ncbi:MAG: hypothetical protein K0Q70_1494, partial [Rhodospirillales bacterium]|nr:hypothetical protein [Rhodospirillales bacterium]